MGASTVDTSSDIPSKYDLDGTELYGPEGKTIADLQELNPEDLKNILDIKKELQEQPK